MKELPTYWTDDLRGLTVFDVIKDTVKQCPKILEEIKKLIKNFDGNNQ